MIDRKAFWISGTLVVLMVMAAFWRISQLADWTQLPRFGENGAVLPPVNSWVLFFQPGAVLLVAGVLALRVWTSRAPRESLRPWRKWATFLLVAYSVILSFFQLFVILRSLGLLTAISPLQTGRMGIILISLMVIVISNSIPKMPWLASRIGVLDLNSENGARVLRLKGRIGVALGLIFIACALWLPAKLLLPVIFGVAITASVAQLLFRIRLKRGQPQ